MPTEGKRLAKLQKERCGTVGAIAAWTSEVFTNASMRKAVTWLLAPDAGELRNSHRIEGNHLSPNFI